MMGKSILPAGKIKIVVLKRSHENEIFQGTSDLE
jgi:hypothetical protein